MEATTLDRLNRMPRITWHFLRMNETQAAIPALARPQSGAISVEPVIDGAVTVVTAQSDNDAFDAALARYNRAAEQWETANGLQAEGWLAQACSRQVVLEIPENSHVGDLTVRIDAQDGAATTAQIDVIAHAGCRARVNVRTDSPQAGSGAVGAAVRVLAEEGARVAVRAQQTLDATWQYLENIAVYEAADAHVAIEQVELGAAESYVGVAVNLAGDRSELEIDARYLGNAERLLDFNYVIRQRGRQTRSDFIANGVLTDTARKTLRGTIDLIHGCKGSVGNESETVLLSNEKVRNKTVPIILCDEDDVQGNHGATIGHVNPAQLHYLQTRGLDTATAEALFSQALFDLATERAADDDAAQAVDRLALQVLGRAIGETAEEEAE